MPRSLQTSTCRHLHQPILINFPKVVSQNARANISGQTSSLRMLRGSAHAAGSSLRGNLGKECRLWVQTAFSHSWLCLLSGWPWELNPSAPQSPHLQNGVHYRLTSQSWEDVGDDDSHHVRSKCLINVGNRLSLHVSNFESYSSLSQKLCDTYNCMNFFPRSI